ncbi:hypothetical protein [Thauera linaloolentis]|uniref:Transmembrane protein n=1 Tax=Thauera linaloolentis (strain DSM 12138 / JCM 21573 / CCUG 41526 / CIP 105981 / IAM 15112 / NBRC 102519 / 47Lol) TaxID=1123367 RepID=N6Y6Z6_THAL4|nr:hypothetical protein [Thauera linaloolentis]ENO90006.1 hypothetical protein C666_03935 [Thauera linaloolentis 47Lol = DSM 12138]MCM8566566.1 hypothetical protein [Thauera linaloolentis]
MPSSSPATPAGLPGDIARRRAKLGLLVLAIALPLSWWLFSRLEPIWDRIMPLEGLPFMGAATLLGAALAIAPLAAGIGFLLAVWFGVDSVYLPRRAAHGPLLDRLIVALAMVVWFSPTLFAIAAAGRGLYEGRIHFVRPPRDYLLATDPIAFWQGVGFWLIMAGLFGFLAWRYWRPRLFPGSAAQD